MKKYQDKKWLEKQYQTRSIESIAEELDCGSSTVNRWIHCHGIKTYPKTRKTKRKKVKYPKLQNKNWLKEQYLINQKSEREIAAMVGSTGGNVHCALKYAEIPIRSTKEGKTLRDKRKAPELQSKKWLMEQYITLEKSTNQIAREILCSGQTVLRALKKHKIPIRSYSKIMKLKKGSKAHNWKGGKFVTKREGDLRYIYIYNPEHPYSTKDGYVMEHRLVMEKHLERFLIPMKEVVHHINGNPIDNRFENLQVVTKKEHSRIHFNAVKEVTRLKKLLDEHNIKY